MGEQRLQEGRRLGDPLPVQRGQDVAGFPSAPGGRRARLRRLEDDLAVADRQTMVGGERRAHRDAADPEVGVDELTVLNRRVDDLGGGVGRDREEQSLDGHPAEWWIWSVSTPTTLPPSANSGPPELPKSIAASCRTRFA